MGEILRVLSFNYQCPEIVAASQAKPDVMQKNPFGHFSVLMIDIPGHQSVLNKLGLPQINFDNLNIAPEEALPWNVNPYTNYENRVVLTFNMLPSFDGPTGETNELPSGNWLELFTFNALSDSMRFNYQQPHPTNVQFVLDKFFSVVSNHPDKHILVIDGHGGLKPLVVGEKYGTVMPATKMLEVLTNNLQQFFLDIQTLSDRYSCILFTPCDGATDILPDELADVLGIPLFYIAGKSSGGVSYPTWLGED